MGIRFRRSKSLGKMGKVNLTKGGLGVSFGPRGARVGVGPRGAYTSAGIPGTGLYSINYAKKGKKGTLGQAVEEPPEGKAADVMPVPKELNTSSLPYIIFIVSLILIFIQPVIGILGLVGSIGWLFIRQKKPKAQAESAFHRARKHFDKGEYNEALIQLEKAIEYEPAVPALLPHLSNISFRVEDYPRAENYLEEYLKYKPDDVAALFNYGLALSTNGKPEKAIPVLQKLPDEFKQELPFIIALGNAFLKNNQPELALEVLEKGPTRKRKMDDHMKLFRYTLGCAYKEMGQTQKAINQLQKVYAVDMEYENVSELLEELQPGKT